jgi:ABC-type branched-subunit amino acid transport system substrate-binding protein
VSARRRCFPFLSRAYRLRCDRLALAACLWLLASPASAEVLIGVAAPISGRFAGQGDAIETAVAEAVATVNAAGGVLGHKLRTVAADDGCDAKVGAQAARKLVGDKVAVVIGHKCASAALAAAPVYAASSTLLLSLTRHPDLTDKRAGPTIFRMAGRDDRQGEAIATHLLANWTGQRIGLVHDRTRYGKSVVEGALRALTEAGTSAVFSETIVAGEKSYDALAMRAAQAGVDVLVFGGYGSEAVVLQQALRARRVNAPLIGGEALAETVASGALDAAYARAAGSSGTDRNLAADAEHDTMAAISALHKWIQAAKSAGSLEPAKIAAALAGTGGGAGFNSRGDASVTSYRVVRVRHGKVEPAR